MLIKRFDIQAKARLFAIERHGNQKYSKDAYPYLIHLEDVVNVLKHFGYTEDKYICAGYLHDTMEDTPTSHNDIKKVFGIEVAEIVYCVTDELGRNRKERHEKTYPKILSNPDAIVVKLADRIANVENGIFNKEYEFVKMYAGEYEEFKKILQTEGVCDEMWAYLDELYLNAFKKV